MNFWQSHTIRLRAVEPADAETLHAWNLDSERNRLLDFLWPPTSLASERAWAEEQAKRKPEDDHFHFIIETIDCTPVGTISTHACSPRDGSFSYGVDIAAEYRGKGYAGEAIRLLLRYFFNELRYHKVTVQIHADNPASLRLHEKLGFQREGLLREVAYQHGHYIDVTCYGLTAEEFDKLDKAR